MSKTLEHLLTHPTDGICARATSFSELKKLFLHTTGASAQLLNTLRSCPLAAPLAETSTVLSCCHPDIVKIRKIISKYSDLKILVFLAVADEVATFSSSSASASVSAATTTTTMTGTNNNKTKSSSGATTAASPPFLSKTRPVTQQDVTFLANVIGLLYGLVFPTASQPVACAALVKEKNTIERSEEYALSNAAERRRALQHSVLSVFSDKGQRFHFSKVWTTVIDEVLFQSSVFLASTTSTPSSAPQQQQQQQKQKTLGGGSSSLLSPLQQIHILSLHLLTDVNNAIIPWLTNPLLLSDPLTQAYRGGGLLAVLALEGLLTLMTNHGLEYPGFYSGLYALVTPDIFSSPHRNRFFRLLSLALSSVRVSAAIAASFIKKLARCALVCPSPALYFVLPFIRQKLQQHSNCFALIHRSLRDVEEEEKEVEQLQKKQEVTHHHHQAKRRGREDGDGSQQGNNNNNTPDQQFQRVERLKKLFEGVDPFEWSQPDPEKSHAIDSTLWELSILERHLLPAVRNAVASFASPAEDHQQLQFERSYARLFAHSMSMTESGSGFCTVVQPAVVALQNSSSFSSTATAVKKTTTTVAALPYEQGLFSL